MSGTDRYALSGTGTCYTLLLYAFAMPFPILTYAMLVPGRASELGGGGVGEERLTAGIVPYGTIPMLI